MATKKAKRHERKGMKHSLRVKGFESEMKRSKAAKKDHKKGGRKRTSHK